MEEYNLEKEVFGYENADAYIRKSYKGGWCYVVPEKTNKVYHEGFTADVNSLYPSVMYDKELPFGEPIFFERKI